MTQRSIRVLLADDDIDDCILFEDALTEVFSNTILSTVNDGEQLMRKLMEEPFLPDVLFLDLNMPRKNGFDCLVEIMSDPRTRSMPVIIFSTSFNPDIVKLLHAKGALCYIRKPDEFETLKRVISEGIQLAGRRNVSAFHEFVLNY